MSTTLKERFINYLDSSDVERKRTLRGNINNVSLASKPRDVWGCINETVSCGKGAKFVSCSGHGGFLVSVARNMCIDEELRKVGYDYYLQTGMYEEDCDFAIYTAYFPYAGMRVSPKFFDNEEHVRRWSVERILERYNEWIIESILDRHGF